MVFPAGTGMAYSSRQLCKAGLVNAFKAQLPFTRQLHSSHTPWTPAQVPISPSIEGLPGSSNKRRFPACATVPGTMGKNQQHKSMQMAKHSSRSGGGEAGEQDARYNGHDASFHTAEWHAARLAALSMERPR